MFRQSGVVGPSPAQQAAQARQAQQEAAAAAQAMGMAATELEYRVELLNRMVAACFEKCSARPFKDGSMSVGETVCADRCAAKYWQVVAIVGTLLGAKK